MNGLNMIPAQDDRRLDVAPSPSGVAGVRCPGNVPHFASSPFRTEMQIPTEIFFGWKQDRRCLKESQKKNSMV
jgi:hypothetical protein